MPDPTGASRSLRLAVHFAAVLLTALLGTSGCSTAPPEGVSAVTPFDIERYLGKWYEIARLDHSFERGLTDVSATYRLRADGSVEVVNRGYDPKRGGWREAVGRALFTGDRGRGSLKVSFFGPFYGGYHVVALDQKEYAWSLVMGPDRDYLWILAREKRLPEDVRARLLEQARGYGIDVGGLIWVEQSRGDG
ncbi:MAG: lipocalin family protein [Gammaproteobacteria bacterium]|nr:lipocalin family protein [Gammaproteobacteria bacterium]